MTVAKLKAEGSEAELGDGSLHNHLVKNCLVRKLRITVVGSTFMVKPNLSGTCVNG